MTPDVNWDESAGVGTTSLATHRNHPPYVAAIRLAELAGYHEETIRRWIQAGQKFPGAIKQGQRWLIPTAEVLAEFPALVDHDLTSRRR